MSLPSINTTKNNNQFITVTFFKNHFGYKDNQDDATILDIVNDSNGNVRTKIKAVFDDINAFKNSLFYPRARACSIQFAEAEKLRILNQMYDEAKTAMAAYNANIKNLQSDIRADAPVRTSREVVHRDTPEEDEYFATRRWP